MVTIVIILSRYLENGKNEIREANCSESQTDEFSNGDSAS